MAANPHNGSLSWNVHSTYSSSMLNPKMDLQWMRATHYGCANRIDMQSAATHASLNVSADYGGLADNVTE